MSGIFQLSPKAADYKTRVERFMDEHVYPNEQELFHVADTQPDRWEPLALLQAIKEKAKAQGLWNLFLPGSEHGAGLTNLEYAPLAEIMGRSHWAPEVFNCSAPDTGNMEVLVRYGSEAQKEQWLKPLLAGEIRSGFAMTEPGVASSDATNIRSRSRATATTTSSTAANGGHPALATRAAKSSSSWARPTRQRRPAQAAIHDPGADGYAGRRQVERMLPVFGYHDAPHGHGEVELHERARAGRRTCCSARGAASRSRKAASGRAASTTACALIGRAERALEKMCARAASARRVRQACRRAERHGWSASPKAG